MKRKTILIVDDEPVSVKILTHQLEKEYTIILAHSGGEALEVIARTIPDIILLDILMPEIDGYEVYRIIRKNPAFDSIPVLFITSLPDVECEAEGLEMGANDYIHKPFNADLVRLRIKNHLDFSQAHSLLVQRSAELQALNTKLEATLAQVKLLEGIIPICSYCHKIRDDKDVWNQLERYLTDHSEALFSHGICPECHAEQKDILKKMKPQG
ncbi:MAG TPA: response regulator [Desulfuromonadales bacterium]|nr:response regulator [Desulfuromonadales bacterium]